MSISQKRKWVQEQEILRKKLLRFMRTKDKDILESLEFEDKNVDLGDEVSVLKRMNRDLSNRQKNTY